MYWANTSMEQKNVLLRTQDLGVLKQLAENRAISANAVIRQLILEEGKKEGLI